jgi:hypothetical protein
MAKKEKKIIFKNMLKWQENLLLQMYILQNLSNNFFSLKENIFSSPKTGDDSL